MKYTLRDNINSENIQVKIILYFYDSYKMDKYSTVFPKMLNVKKIPLFNKGNITSFTLNSLGYY